MSYRERGVFWKSKIGAIIHRRVQSSVVTGTGRVGTNFIAHAANQVNPNWLSFHEPENDLHDLFQAAMIRGVDRSMVDLVLRHRAKLWWRGGKCGGYLECNPFLAQCPELLSRGMKHARVAVVVRGWEDCVRSLANMSGEAGPYFMADSDHRSRLSALDFGVMTTEMWTGLNRLERISWWWSQINEELLHQAKKSSWHVVRFESLFGENSNSELGYLFHFLGLISHDEITGFDFQSMQATNSSEQRASAGASISAVTREDVLREVRDEHVLNRVNQVTSMIGCFFDGTQTHG